MISCTNVYKYANEAGGGDPKKNSPANLIADEAGGGEPSDPSSANYDITTSEATDCDTASRVDTIAEPCLTDDELTFLRKHRRTVVTTDAVECKVILIGRWTLNNQYEEDAEVRV